MVIPASVTLCGSQCSRTFLKRNASEASLHSRDPKVMKEFLTRQRSERELKTKQVVRSSPYGNKAARRPLAMGLIRFRDLSRRNWP